MFRLCINVNSLCSRRGDQHGGRSLYLQRFCRGDRLVALSQMQWFLISNVIAAAGRPTDRPYVILQIICIPLKSAKNAYTLFNHHRHRPIRPPMNFTRPIFSKCNNMLLRRITFMFSKSILWINFIKLHHFTIT